MKILHFSDQGLPDTRLERYGFIQGKLGYERIFVGGSVNSIIIDGSFTDYIRFDLSRSAKFGLPYFYSQYKKNFLKIYNSLKPDLVHCHNYLPAKVCYDLKIRYIYDDHEFWKEFIKDIQRERRDLFAIRRKLTTRLTSSFISKWQAKLAEAAFTVFTVTQPIVDYYKTLNNETYLIPNYPSSQELTLQHEFDKNYDEIRSLIVVNYNTFSTRKSTDKFIELYSKNNKKLFVIGNVPKKFDNIEYLGYLNHNDYIKKLNIVHLGLTPFEENRLPSFYYYGSNRYFQFGHSGIIPVLHENMTYLRNTFENFNFSIRNEEEIMNLFSVIDTEKNKIIKMSQDLRKYSKENFVFDKYTQLIKRIYEEGVNS